MSNRSNQWLKICCPISSSHRGRHLHPSTNYPKLTRICPCSSNLNSISKCTKWMQVKVKIPSPNLMATIKTLATSSNKRSMAIITSQAKMGSTAMDKTSRLQTPTTIRLFKACLELWIQWQKNQTWISKITISQQAVCQRQSVSRMREKSTAVPKG